ncbi:MAG: LiaI-LiaF-like domain-containing protein [Flectobacillus sp.]|uniref:LiaI-LiaF-like domain-containing protein n=1 Tax=Flectobacillus sp. TaxID=50419 RepID=UPI003B9D59FC
MNSKNIFAGGFLILLGILFLGKEYGWFHIHWHDIARMWPLLLIYMGLMAFVGKTSRSATVISIIMIAIFIPLVLVKSCVDDVKSEVFDGDRDFHLRFDDKDQNNNNDNDEGDTSEDDKSSYGEGGKQHIVEPMNASIKTANFELNGGAAEFIIDGSSSDLVEADADLDFGKISLGKTGDGDNPSVNFKLTGKKEGINFDSDRHNKVSLKFNPNVLWNMRFEFGAGKADFDFSSYRIKQLDIKTGVTETDIKLGDLSDNMIVNVESGLTSIEFEVPEVTGCRIKVKGGLNSKNFEGFVKKGDYWESPDYDKSTKKILINFEGGLQDLKVKRY